MQRTPRYVVDRLHGELVKAINSSDVRGRLSDEEAEIETTTPEQLTMFVRKGMDKWAEAAKISGAKLD